MEQLANYQKLCDRSLGQEIEKRDRARRDLVLLTREAVKHKVMVGLGVASFIGGLFTTGILGPAGVGLTGVSGALTVDSLNDLRRSVRDRVQLRNDIAEYEDTIRYWQKESVRTLDEWRRRRS